MFRLIGLIFIFAGAFVAIGAIAQGDSIWTGVGLAVLGFVLRLFAPRRSTTGSGGQEEGGDGDEKPLVSIVLLHSKPRPLDEAILMHMVEDAWGGNYTPKDEDDDEENLDGFVVSPGPGAPSMVRSPRGMFLVHNVDGSYFDNLEEAAASIDELRIRTAVENHTAWSAVDLLSALDDSQPQEVFYSDIAKLVAQIATEDTLVVARPETGQLNIWNEEVLAAMLTPTGHDDFNRPVNAPVIEVADDDPMMLAAVKEARDRWGEFREAFEKKDGEMFIVKAPITVGDSTEFIWLEVIGLEPDYIHGTLANDPVNLAGLKMGSQVEVPVAELNDWAMGGAGKEPVGMFTVKAIEESRKRAAG